MKIEKIEVDGIVYINSNSLIKAINGLIEKKKKPTDVTIGSDPIRSYDDIIVSPIPRRLGRPPKIAPTKVNGDK